MRHAVDETPTLTESLAAIRDSMQVWRARVPFGVAPPAVEKRDRIRRNVYDDLEDLECWIGLLCEIIQELLLTSPFRNLESAERHREVLHRAKNVIKALYEGLYVLREDLEKDPELLSALDSDQRSRLTRYGAFRKALVTHKSELMVYASAGIRYSVNDYSRIELLLVPFGGFPPNANRELSQLYADVEVYLPPEIRAESNEIERIGLLYRHMDELPGEFGARITTFMNRYGTISDFPGELAHFVASLAATLAKNA